MLILKIFHQFNKLLSTNMSNVRQQNELLNFFIKKKYLISEYTIFTKKKEFVTVLKHLECIGSWKVMTVAGCGM